MKTNARKKSRTAFTHEGARAKNIPVLQQLRRSVMSTMLFEDTFYEDGQTISDRIIDLAGKVTSSEVAKLAIEARTDGNLRHVPLLLAYKLTETAAGSNLPSETLTQVIQRADEITEFVALYKKYSPNGKLSKQVKLGLAAAFHKFDEYQFAKYDRKDLAWRLRDVMFLVHPKPTNKKQKKLFEDIANDKLKPAKTWEVELSKAGQTATSQQEKQASKKEIFETKLRTSKLGYMALLRNLKGMHEAGVDQNLVRKTLLERRGAHKVLPFRFVAAAKAAPHLEPFLDKALCANILEMPVFKGRTAVLVDVSDSMNMRISAKSEMSRMDAAATLASVINAEDLRVFTFSNHVVEVPPRRGMAGVDVIKRSQIHYGTYLGKAITTLNVQIPHDRLIVITDEQSHDTVPDPIPSHAYMINVASDKNGVGYGKWTHIDGFSESVLRFIMELEKLDTATT